MIIDARHKRSGMTERAKRTKVIDAKTGEEIPRVVAINTMTRTITRDVLKDERRTLFEEQRDEKYEIGQYLLLDVKTGLRWPADAIIIPCLQRDGQPLEDCPCFDCLKE